MEKQEHARLVIHFERITARTVEQICELSETLTPQQRKVVADYADGIACPGVFLWRFMIAGPFQRKGYGRRAMQVLFAHLKALGVPELYTSYELGEASPEGFYRKLGFVPTGGTYGDEVEAICRINVFAQEQGERK